MDAPANFQKLLRHVFEEPANVASQIRRSIGRFAAAAAGGTLPGGEPPSDLVDYVDKVSRHAYRVSDDDIQALRRAGYSEDAVFEITVAAAVGASYARMQAGLRALEEADG